MVSGVKTLWQRADAATVWIKCTTFCAQIIALSWWWWWWWWWDGDDDDDGDDDGGGRDGKKRLK